MSKHRGPAKTLRKTSAQKKRLTMRRPRISPLPEPLDDGGHTSVDRNDLRSWEEIEESNLGPDDE
jgi:hypothetical protein